MSSRAPVTEAGQWFPVRLSDQKRAGVPPGADALELFEQQTFQRWDREASWSRGVRSTADAASVAASTPQDSMTRGDATVAVGMRYKTYSNGTAHSVNIDPSSRMPRLYCKLARATLGAAGALSIGCSDGTGPGLSALPTQPIVFMRPFSGWDIVRINPDSTGETTLTSNPRDDTNPSWSPDRKRIAYVSSRADGIGVYVMDADGNDQGLVFRPELAELYLPVRPAWAPDQQWLAYFEGFNLIRVRLDGTGARLIGEGAAPSWSPDGQRIAFMRNDGISVSNIDGTDRRPVVASGSYPAWSPDGRRIAYAAGDFGARLIYTVNADGTDVRRITEMADSMKITDESPVWSPDGRWIAFQREHGCVSPVYCIGARDIFVTRADGTDLRQVTTTGKSERPSW